MADFFIQEINKQRNHAHFGWQNPRSGGHLFRAGFFSQPATQAAGNGAGAESEALGRDVQQSKRVNEQRGVMMESFKRGPLNTISRAVAHGRRPGFSKAMLVTLTRGNHCHKAVGSPFAKVTLLSGHPPSIRPPLRGEKSPEMSGHKHTH